MKDKTYKIKIDAAERGMILTALVELRNKYIEENKEHDIFDDTILKLCRN